MAGQAYTIDIPGATDILRLPIHEGYPTLKQIKDAGGTREDYLKQVPQEIRDLRKQRAMRMATANSPVPKPLQWIPSVITHIDDAQDLLYTGLTLAKPLLKKLPARFIPGLGWALVAMDIANLATFLLSGPLTGGATKAKLRGTLRKIRKPKEARLRRVPYFLKHTPWLSFTLQAGQATETLTGYGLRLGPVMGMASDAIWGGLRKAQGKEVIFRGPPSKDPVVQSYRILTQSHQQVHYQQILTPYEEAIIIAANNMAVQIIQDAGEVSKVEEMNETIAGAKRIIFEPWNEESIEGLKAAGMPTNGEDMRQVTMLPDDAPFIDVVRASADLEMQWQEHRKVQYRECDSGTIMQQIHSEAGEGMWNLLNGEEGTVEDVPDQYEVIMMKAVEWNIRPKPHPGTPYGLMVEYEDKGEKKILNPNGIPQWYVQKTMEWLKAVKTIMDEEHRDWPTGQIMKAEGFKIFGKQGFIAR